MESDERDITAYLRSWPGQFISGREIARRASGKWRYRENKDWAVPVLSRMVERGMLESDSTGHFRLILKSKKDKPKKWVSPQIQRILEQSGKDFSGTIEIQDEGEL